MTINKQIKYFTESAALLIIVLFINILLKPADPGFSEILYTPYIAAALFSAVYHGRRFGLFNIVFTAAAVTVFSMIHSGIFRPNLHKQDMIIFASSVFFIYIFGSIREIDRLKIKNIKEHLRKTTKDCYRTKKLSAAQIAINREMEERVSGQRGSITTLYNQMHQLDSLNLDKSLDVLVETVKIFSEATKLSIWTRSPSPGFLHCVAAANRDNTLDATSLLNIDDSIEGWVFRNNRVVSVRMINNYENLRKMDTGRNIITMPIQLNKKVWGVLNIEDMPFVKYNSHTEKLLEIIINLAEPALSRAVEHDRQVQQSETDTDTMLPLFSQLYNTLNRYIQASSNDKTQISLLIIEIQNFNALSEKFPPSKLKKLFLNLTDELLLASAGLAEFFMYKSDNQMAVLIPGIDSDGTALLCLEILETINSAAWHIGTEEVFIEVIIGYGSLGDNATDTDGLIKHAETLLEIQKI